MVRFFSFHFATNQGPKYQVNIKDDVIIVRVRYERANDLSEHKNSLTEWT